MTSQCEAVWWNTAVRSQSHPVNPILAKSHQCVEPIHNGQFPRPCEGLQQKVYSLGWEEPRTSGGNLLSMTWDKLRMYHIKWAGGCINVASDIKSPTLASHNETPAFLLACPETVSNGPIEGPTMVSPQVEAPAAETLGLWGASSRIFFNKHFFFNVYIKLARFHEATASSLLLPNTVAQTSHT